MDIQLKIPCWNKNELAENYIKRVRIKLALVGLALADDPENTEIKILHDSLNKIYQSLTEIYQPNRCQVDGR